MSDPVLDRGITRCRSCQAPIRWVTTMAGKSMPIDLEPVPQGTVHIVGGNRVEVLNREGITALHALEPGVPLYLSHFATCPQAASHRRKAKAATEKDRGADAGG